MRYTAPVKNKRHILCVFPSYTPSFGTFQHAFPLMWRVKAFMPPQGLLLIAAYMPESWEVRFLDENIRRATAADFAWADVVLASGMHVQARQIHDIAARAKAAGKVTALGGPSVSASPEMYPEYDYVHIGELGDATDRLIAALDADVRPQPAQVRPRPNPKRSWSQSNSQSSASSVISPPMNPEAASSIALEADGRGQQR